MENNYGSLVEVLTFQTFPRNTTFVRHVKTPNIIAMQRHKENPFPVTFLNCTIIVPDCTSQWTDLNINPGMCVTKTTLSVGEGLSVHFKHVDENFSIYIVGTVNRRPVLEDFKDAVVLSKGYEYFSAPLEEHFSHTADAYVAFLPTQKMMDIKGDPENEFSGLFEIGHEIQKCLSWDYDKREYINTQCQVIYDKILDDSVITSFFGKTGGLWFFT